MASFDHDLFDDKSENCDVKLGAWLNTAAKTAGVTRLALRQIAAKTRR